MQKAYYANKCLQKAKKLVSVLMIFSLITSAGIKANSKLETELKLEL